MSVQHLSDLRSALGSGHWVIAEEMPGDGRRISAVWRVTRPDGTHGFHLEFDGLADLDVLPIEKAYGVTVRENREIGAYFARINRTWPSELASFNSKLEQWAST